MTCGRLQRLARACLLVAAPFACQKAGAPAVQFNTGVTPATHTRFPIKSGVHATDCNTCHGEFQSFKQFTCLNCHAHDRQLTDELHRSLPGAAVGTPPDGGMGYAYSSTSCLQCHATGSRVPFDHAGITSSCASCHDVAAPFVALPVAGVGLDGGVFTHPDKGGNDCRACHTTSSWSGAAGAPDGARDPARDAIVAALIPSYSGPSISAMTPRTEALPMPMDHRSAAVPSAAFSACINCHANANANSFFPGSLHGALTALKVPQPAQCLDCHASSVPAGFVGITNATRTPPSGAMKHDAVLWINGAPSATPAVPSDCAACHAVPANGASGWATTQTFHASISNHGLAQPSSCLDCHANSRPSSLLTSSNAALPANLTFDHATGPALGDCQSCHLNGSSTQFTSWTGGVFHLAGAAPPASCLPCHSGERPSTTAGWVSPGYQTSPFDYGTNAAGITHGDGQDCVACHSGPGTGVWGGTPKQNWAGGGFVHGAASVSATTCLNCHLSQRPDAAAKAVLPGNFDHSVNGTGDCFGCHQATVAANRYVNYFKPSTGTLPGGDWQGGIGYPGSVLVSAPGEFLTVNETTLNRSGANNLVTSTSTISARLNNAMLHDSTALPPELNAGPATTPQDYSKCWHCHTSSGTTVTAFANGKYHASLTNYSATPGGTIVPFPQPANHCTDCHVQMRPAGIVAKAGFEKFQPMDHDAAFTATVAIDGAPVNRASQIDCSTCHKSYGSAWTDGTFHSRIGGAVPQDCTVCHYTLMADAPSSDLTSGVQYSMKHQSGQFTFQNCQVCHTGSLSQGAVTPPTSSLWRAAVYHASLAAQPRACNDCHTVSEPAGGASTQSNVAYALPAGATSSNQAQWMNHGSAAVVGKDCVGCHAVDATASGSAWRKGDSYHAALPASSTCNECHGLTNGGGTVPGTNNNLPSGLTDSSMVTTAGTSTGVPAGTHDQITHSDVNASAHDCSFCHTQQGVSAAPGVQGREWAQAGFHASFGAANPLVLNGTTGRCSNCHSNVKPTPSFTAFDHSALTAAPGTLDCTTCHSWPGTGAPSSPNWLGASAAPQFIPVGAFPIPQPPAPAATTQRGINQLPHPATGGQACTACHASPSGGKPAIGYDHASALVNTNCAACHEAGSNLVGTVWNGASNSGAGAGDTRPFTLPSVRATYKGNTSIETNPNHFFLDKGNAQVDCSWCHKPPAGNGLVTTGSAYTAAWAFTHPPENPNNYNFCFQCHLNGPPR